MKRAILAILAMLVCAAFVFADITGNSRTIFSDAIGTNQYGYDIARTVTTNDTALTNTTRDWGAISTVFHPLPSTWSNVCISFYGYGDGTGDGSPDGGTFDFTVYVARRYGGAVQVCTQNDAAVGNVQLSHNPFTGAAFNSGAEDSDYCWVDTFAVTADYPVSMAEGGGGGANNIGTLCFDTLGHRGIYIVVTDITSLSGVTYVISGIGG